MLTTGNFCLGKGLSFQKKNYKCGMAMKAHDRRKGYIYIIEVLIAISIMLSAILFIFGTTADAPDSVDVVIGQTGIDALKYLDNKGDLRAYAYNGNEAGLEDALSPLISDNIAFETEICTASCDTTNVTGTRTVITFDYFISGYKDSYVGKRVRLWLWERI